MIGNDADNLWSVFVWRHSDDDTITTPNDTCENEAKTSSYFFWATTLNTKQSKKLQLSSVDQPWLGWQKSDLSKIRVGWFLNFLNSDFFEFWVFWILPVSEFYEFWTCHTMAEESLTFSQIFCWVSTTIDFGFAIIWVEPFSFQRRTNTKPTCHSRWNWITTITTGREYQDGQGLRLAPSECTKQIHWPRYRHTATDLGYRVHNLCQGTSHLIGQAKSFVKISHWSLLVTPKLWWRPPPMIWVLFNVERVVSNQCDCAATLSTISHQFDWVVHLGSVWCLLLVDPT